MKKETINKFNSNIKYPNLVGMAFFMALTIVQTILFLVWFVNNSMTINTLNGKYQFPVKGLASFVLMSGLVFYFLNILVKKVARKDLKVTKSLICITTYIMTIPTVVSVNFITPIYGICASLLIFNTIFACQYFYDRHDLRLYRLIGMFAILCELQYLNRAAFWAGVAETFLFLSIQLYRNIRTKRKNMADKSWRNTLLLFCILIIIVLMPQYFSYNKIHATRYNNSVRQQVAARAIVPYLELERIERKNEYLLGVVRAEDYGLGRNYRNFNKIMYRYESDNLDMEEIWNNLYTNAKYRYGKTIVERYIKNSVRGVFAPLVIRSEMNSKNIISHHGYYYGLFQNKNPKVANVYMNFGMISQMLVVMFIFIQLVVKIVLDCISGKFKMKVQSGKHKVIEGILLGLCVTVVYILAQTLFSLEGTSYVTSISATMAWMFTTSFLWFERSNEIDNL